MSSTVSNPYSFNIQNNTSFNSKIQSSNNLKTIIFSSDGRYPGSTTILENGISSKFKVMLEFCINLDISTENEEGPIYDPDKWELLSAPLCGVFNLDNTDIIAFFDGRINDYDPESRGLDLVYSPIKNIGSYAYILDLSKYSVDHNSGGDYPVLHALTEALTDDIPIENILVLMREYDGKVNDSYFIQYSTPEIENDTTIRSTLNLFDPSIFKTIADNYFVLNTSK